MAYAHDPAPAPVAAPAAVADHHHATHDHAEEPPPGFLLQPPCPTATGGMVSAGALPSPPVTDRGRVPSIERGLEQANRYLTQSGAKTLATAEDVTITDDAHLEYVGIDVDWDTDDWAFQSGTVCR